MAIMFDGVKRLLGLLLGDLPVQYTNFYPTRQQNSPRLPSWSIEIPRRAYMDRPERGASGHSLQLVARRQDHHCWHVRLVVEYGLIRASTPAERKAAVVQLCDAIDFGLLPLLNDTVTEVYVYTKQDTTTALVAGKLPAKLTYTPLPEGHPFNPDGKAVYVETCEDPLRVRYPLCNGTTTTARLVQWSDVCVMRKLAVAVSTARVASDKALAEPQIYVLKTIERLLYLPQDSEALQQELHVLEKVGGQDNIARLIAAVVSDNPYNTSTGNPTTSCVLRGILIEYYPNGTLAEALQAKNGKHGDDKKGGDDAAAAPPWRLLGAQLCMAVATLHEQNITHMDIKPSNMMLDKDSNLVLIDVGGAGGVTGDWLSPAMRKVLDPLGAPLQDRKQNDIWAVGKILSEIADASSRGGERLQIQMAARKAMDCPALTSLSQLGAGLLQK